MIQHRTTLSAAPLRSEIDRLIYNSTAQLRPCSVVTMIMRTWKRMDLKIVNQIWSASSSRFYFIFLIFVCTQRFRHRDKLTSSWRREIQHHFQFRVRASLMIEIETRKKAARRFFWYQMLTLQVKSISFTMFCRLFLRRRVSLDFSSSAFRCWFIWLDFHEN